MTKSLSIKEVQYIAYKLAKKFMDWNEPIPSFSERTPGVLESCLLQPFQKIGGKALYRGLNKKAAILFYLMIKNHPFQNGNKRIAVFTLTLLLLKNSKWLYVSNKELLELALEVSKSKAKDRKKIVAKVTQFIEGNTHKQRLS